MIKEARSLVNHYINATARKAQKVSLEHHRRVLSFKPLLLNKKLDGNSKGSKLLPTETFREAFDCSNKARKRKQGLRNSYRNSSAMAATASDSGDDVGSRTQQSPLASQRAKTSNAPTEANRTGKMGGYFTLGYKEGFGQWVCPSWRRFRFSY